jgi:hypothetical protein
MRTITFTGHLDAADGGNAVGWVQVAALATVPVPDADTIITEQPIDLQLVAGSFATPLVLPTDVGSLTPVFVEVHQLLDGTRPVSRVVNVQTAADVLDYADAPEVVFYPSLDGVPAVPWSAVGQPGGVAPLGSNGRVPALYLPVGGGTGGLSYHHVQTIAQAVWPVPHMLGQKPSSVAMFSPDWLTQYDEFRVHHVDEDNLLLEGDVPVDGHALIGI